MKKRRDPHQSSTEKFSNLRHTMFGLVGNDNFQNFIEELREMQHSTMIDLCSDAVVKDDRMTLASTGELRAYSQIIGLYDDFVQQQLLQAETDAEDRGA
jgi:hypothetical protein